MSSPHDENSGSELLRRRQKHQASGTLSLELKPMTQTSHVVAQRACLQRHHTDRCRGRHASQTSITKLWESWWSFWSFPQTGSSCINDGREGFCRRFAPLSCSERPMTGTGGAVRVELWQLMRLKLTGLFLHQHRLLLYLIRARECSSE